MNLPIVKPMRDVLGVCILSDVKIGLDNLKIRMGIVALSQREALKGYAALCSMVSSHDYIKSVHVTQFCLTNLRLWRKFIPVKDQ